MFLAHVFFIVYHDAYRSIERDTLPDRRVSSWRKLFLAVEHLEDHQKRLASQASMFALVYL